MTNPDSVSSQILVEVGKLQAQVAVMDERLKSVPDHEARLRHLERESAQVQGGRDWAARVPAWAGMVIAAGAVAAAYFHR